MLEGVGNQFVDKKSQWNGEVERNRSLVHLDLQIDLVHLAAVGRDGALGYRGEKVREVEMTKIGEPV